MHLTPAELLTAWLRRQLAPPAFDWLDQTIAQLHETNSDRALYLALGLVTRRLGKESLTLQPADITQAEGSAPRVATATLEHR
jgi:hypothetical protein